MLWHDKGVRAAKKVGNPWPRLSDWKSQILSGFLDFQKSQVRQKSQNFKIWLQKSQIGNPAQLQLQWRYWLLPMSNPGYYVTDRRSPKADKCLGILKLHANVLPLFCPPFIYWFWPKRSPRWGERLEMIRTPWNWSQAPNPRIQELVKDQKAFKSKQGFLGIGHE